MSLLGDRDPPVVYHCRRFRGQYQAWRTKGGRLLPPGAIDVSADVPRTMKTDAAWAAWWKRVYG